MKDHLDCILFDFGDTLIDEKVFLNEAYKGAVYSAFKYYSISLNLEDNIIKFSNILQDKMREFRDISPNQKEVLVRKKAIENFLLSFNIIPNLDERDLIFKSLVDGAAYSNSLFPEAINTLQRLKNAGFKIGIVSNGLAEYTRIFLREHNLLEFFDTIIISEEVNIEKPDSNIFNIALNFLNTKPKEAVMIGNKLYEDIVGAKNAGIKAIWMNKRNIYDDYEITPDYTINNLLQIFEILNIGEE